MPSLRIGRDERLLCFRRKIESNEPIRWIKIILSLLIDNAKEICRVIRLWPDDFVGHSELQRSLILPALNAHRKKRMRSFTAIRSG